MGIPARFGSKRKRETPWRCISEGRMGWDRLRIMQSDIRSRTFARRSISNSLELFACLASRNYRSHLMEMPPDRISSDLTRKSWLDMIRLILRKMMSGLPMKPPGARDRQIGEVTLLLRQCSTGDPKVKAQLVALMYPELKRIAEARMRHERKDHTLQ